eukprot:jgi/Psemu1/12977/gm1.12977_g
MRILGPTRPRQRLSPRTLWFRLNIPRVTARSTLTWNLREPTPLQACDTTMNYREHDVYQAIYTLFTEAGGDRILPLLLDIFNAQAIGGLGIFQEDAAGVDRLRVIHGLRRYPGIITQPSANQGQAFGYIDDVEGEEGELVQVDATLLSRASASRVYLMAHHEAVISQHPDRDYIPAIPEGTAHTEMLQAHKVCFLPFEFIPLVLCRGLTPKQAFVNFLFKLAVELIHPKAKKNNRDCSCRPVEVPVFCDLIFL